MFDYCCGFIQNDIPSSKGHRYWTIEFLEMSDWYYPGEKSVKGTTLFKGVDIVCLYQQKIKTKHS